MYTDRINEEIRLSHFTDENKKKAKQYSNFAEEKETASMLSIVQEELRSLKEKISEFELTPKESPQATEQSEKPEQPKSKPGNSLLLIVAGLLLSMIVINLFSR